MSCLSALLHASLRLTTNRNAAVSAVNSISTRYGVDYPESQLDALYHGTASSSMRWTSGSKGPNGENILKILILATDAPYHQAGDSYLTRHYGQAEPDCNRRDYPSIAQVKSIMQSRGVVPLFLTTSDVRNHYENLRRYIGMGGSVEGIDSSSSNLIPAIHQVRIIHNTSFLIFCQQYN